MNEITSEKYSHDWILSTRLYEEFLFFYFIIIGFFTLGFEVEGLTDKTNLALNFLCLYVFCGLMALTPFWYRFIQE